MTTVTSGSSRATGSHKSRLMTSSIVVGLGDIKISNNSQDILVVYGLGSCVGIGVYDPITHVAGLLHAVLPENKNGRDGKVEKYVDSGIPALLERVTAFGADCNRLIIRMVGGAQMLVVPGATNSFDLGTRNVIAAQKTLKKHNLQLKAHDVGGHQGRSVKLYVSNGKMTLRTVGLKERAL